MKNKFYVMILVVFCLSISNFILLDIIQFFNVHGLTFLLGAFCFAYNSYFYDKIYLYYNTYTIYDSKVYEL